MKRITIILLSLAMVFAFTVSGALAEDIVNENTSAIGTDAVIQPADNTADITETDIAIPNDSSTVEIPGDVPGEQEPIAVVKPEKQIIKSLQPGNKKLTVQWTADPDENARYEIWIASDPQFTEDLYKIERKSPKDLVTKTKLVNGNTYYVKVRTFYEVNGKRYKGKWSKKKSVKVRKTAIYSNTTIRGVPELRTVKKKDDGDLLVLVNKYHTVSSNYSPTDMVSIPWTYVANSNQKIKKQVLKAYKKMSKAANKQGLDFKICSAYRSYSTQRYLFNSYINTKGYKTAFMLSAYPGRSEHHTGLALDLVTGSNGWELDTNFANTKEGKWVFEHCAEYGFIIRYPEGKGDITGYQFEPWHLRYVGKKVAKEIMEEGITLEEYLGKTH